MTKIRITALTADEEPFGNAYVTVSLHHGGAGGAVPGGVVVAPATAKTDGTTGVVIVDLGPNADIDPPDTYYAITVGQTSPTVVRYIEVPEPNGSGDAEIPYDWDDPTIQRLVPVPPTSIPAAVSGDAGDVLTVVDDGNGKRFSLSPATGGAGVTAVVVAGAFAADAVDGTGDLFSFLQEGGAGGGIVPAGWSANPGFADQDAAALDAALTDAFGGSATLLVFSGGEASVRTLTAGSLGEPFPEVPGSYVIGGTTGTLKDGVFYSEDAWHTPYTGTGLLAGLGSVGGALSGLEGTLDRWFTVTGIATEDADITDLGSAVFEYGGLRFIDGNADPVSHCHVWLKNQTDPAETGFYQVETGSLSAAKWEHPDVFDPPGMLYRATLCVPGEPENGMTWAWIADDPTIHQRANGETDFAQKGEWVLYTDPTASGGGGGAVTLTGDVTGTGTGSFATTIGAGKVTDTMLAGSITPSKITGTAVVQARTLAGLDLSADRSAAALRTALGGWQTISRKTLGSASSTESFTITGYKKIRITVAGRSSRTSAAVDSLRMRFNADTGTNYGTDAGALNVYANPASLSASQTNTNRAGHAVIEWCYVASHYLAGTCTATPPLSTGSTGATAETRGFLWTGAASAAPTTVELYCGAGDFVTGTEFLVEGYV